jgi:hypothetical protein
MHAVACWKMFRHGLKIKKVLAGSGSFSGERSRGFAFSIQKKYVTCLKINTFVSIDLPSLYG